MVVVVEVVEVVVMAVKGAEGVKEEEVKEQPNLSEPFYTTTVCVRMAIVAFQYHRKHTYTLPETLLPR